MHCRFYEKQTKRKQREVELDGLKCRQAEHCRRKGICVLSPFSRPELVQADLDAMLPNENGDDLGTHYEVLRFKNALGFQWHRLEGFSEAVKAVARYREQGQPQVIRRMEIFHLPD